MDSEELMEGIIVINRARVDLFQPETRQFFFQRIYGMNFGPLMCADPWLLGFRVFAGH